MTIDTDRWAEDHWDYVEQVGAVCRDNEDADKFEEDNAYSEALAYEDNDQRIGGNDNPYPED